MGLCRLVGHRGPITTLQFMQQQPVLISSSKDTFVKFWDLDTQHCFKTLVGHRTEVRYIPTCVAFFCCKKIEKSKHLCTHKLQNFC